MSQQQLKDLISAKALAQIDQWIAKFPAEQRQSASLQALRIVQDEKGWLAQESLDAVADYLRMPKIAVYEVATFYSMFNLKPVGKYKIDVCNNIACMLCDSDKVINHLQKRLGIKVGETTADGKITLKTVECLGACVSAPVCQIGKQYHENLTPEKLDQILEKLG